MHKNNISLLLLLFFELHICSWNCPFDFCNYTRIHMCTYIVCTIEFVYYNLKVNMPLFYPVPIYKAKR